MKVKEIKKHLPYLSAFIAKDIPVLELLILVPGKIGTNNFHSSYFVDFNHDVHNGIEYKKFVKILQALDPEDDLNFKQDKEKNTVLISINGVIQFSFEAWDVKEFVKLPSLKESPYVVHLGDLDSYAISQIKEALVFTGTDCLRPVFTGVCIGENRIAATDGHSLFFEPFTALMVSNYKQKDESLKNVVLHKWVATVLSKIKTNMEVIAFSEARHVAPNGDVYGNFNPKLLFRGNGFEISTSVIDERYPDYMNVIPDFQSSDHTVLSVETKELEKTVKLALIAANKYTRKIVLKLEESPDEKLRVYSEDLDESTKYQKDVWVKKSLVNITKTLPVVVGQDGEPIEYQPEFAKAIAFNGDYMLKIIKQITQKFSKIELNQANRALVVNGKYLLMPLQLD